MEFGGQMSDMPIKNIMEEKNTNFTIDKATALLKSFSGLMKDGCVSKEVYESRRSACESCDQNQKRQSDNAHFCGSCGCGARPMATLYIEGVPIEEDHSVRLWMPKSNCPKSIHKDEVGTKNFKPVGGRIKQLKEFTLSTLYEAIGQSGKDDKLESVDSTVSIIQSVAESENEMDELADIMIPEIEKIENVIAYNDKGDNKNEQGNDAEK